MQTVEFDGAAERAILTSLIVSDDFLSRVAFHWEKDSFRSKWGNEIGSWCVEFFIKHKTAPKACIVNLFAAWCEQNRDENDKKIIERFLGQLNRRYEVLAEDLNVSHLVEMIELHFNQVRLERRNEDIERRLALGDTAGAIEVAESFRKVQMSAPAYIDIFRDTEAQRLALERKQNVLVRYSEGLGEFFGDELSEDAFITFVAPVKVGKSFSIMDVACTAVDQARKVAYFQVGDMTQDQFLRRLHKRICRRPIGPGVIRWPVSLIPAADGGIASVEHEEIVFDEPMTTEDVHSSYAQIVKRHKSQRFRLSYHPSKTISVNGIKDILNQWERGGWVPSCIFLDYVENLLPNNPKMNELAQVEDTWTHLRQISEVRKCLVVTAAQSNKEGYSNPWVLTKNNFSRNKMIFAVVTGAIGLNQTEAEKINDVIRMNWICRREGRWSTSKCVHVAGCLDIAQLNVLSCF